MNAAPEFVDIHHHFLFSVDDGAGTQDMMYAMLDAAYRDGIRTVFATPHVRPGVCAFERTLCRERLCLARQYCGTKAICCTCWRVLRRCLRPVPFRLCSAVGFPH